VTTTSRPANGVGGFSDADWATRFGGQDGIIEDYDGHSFDMTLLNGSNEAQFTAALISVNGYTLTVPAGERVSLPAPTSGSKTFHIGVLFDSALNVPVAVTQQDGSVVQTATDAGPCRLMAYEDGTVPDSTGKRFLILYTLTRTSAALTGATVSDRRRWVGVAIDFPYVRGLDAAPGNEGFYPRGSIRIDAPNGRVLCRTLTSAGLVWTDPLAAGPFPFPFASNIIARNATGNRVTYSKRAGLAKLVGDVQKSSGSFSSETTLGYLPLGFRPAVPERLLCKTSGAGGQTEVRVDPSNGAVVVTDNGDTFSWVNLSPVIFEAGI